MRNLRNLILLSFAVFSIASCQIRDLKERVSELEKQVNAKDSVIYNDLQITSQAAMDVFAGYGLRVILGQLTIQNCHDLTPLLGLRSVAALRVDASGLNSFAGLDSLESVEYIEIYNIEEGTEFSGFNGIEFSNYIYLSGTVTSSNEMFTGLRVVEQINIDAYNGSVVNISGFNNLEEINNLWVFTNIYSGIQTSVKISGFASITELEQIGIVASSVVIEAFDNLQQIYGLEIIASISAHGFNSLEKVNGYLSLGTPITTDFLSNLNTVDDLNIVSHLQNTSVSSLSYYNIDQLTINSGFAVYGHRGLKDLNGVDFGNMTLESINIHACPQLSDISGLSTYSGTLDYFGLGDLGISSLSGLENITKFLSMEISNCPWLKSLDSLSNLQTEIEYLSLYDNGLQSLEGLEGVPRIAYLNINENTQLENWCAIKDIFDAIPVNQRNINGNLVNPTSSADILNCD